MSFPAANCLLCEYRDVEKGPILFSRDDSSGKKQKMDSGDLIQRIRFHYRLL